MATDYGDETPLYDCTECGDQTVIPGELEEDDVIELECPTCGNETLTYVDGLCRHGRTISPHEPACYNEWDKKWEKPNLTVRVCQDHHDEYTSPLPLPDGAVGRCEVADCTHAVFEEPADGKAICEACRDDRSHDTGAERTENGGEQNDTERVECTNCGEHVPESEAVAGPHGHAVHRDCTDNGGATDKE